MRNLSKWAPFREQRGLSEAWGVREVDGEKVMIPATIRLDAEDADVIARTHNARLERPDRIWTEAIVSHRTGEPVYHFAFGDVTWEMGLRELRQFIGDLYELAEAGITDAFIVKFVRSRLAPVDERKFGSTIKALMSDFRGFREELKAPVVEVEEGEPS